MTNEKYKQFVSNIRKGVKDTTNGMKEGFTDAISTVYSVPNNSQKNQEQKNSFGYKAGTFVGQGTGLATGFVGFASGMSVIKRGYEAIKESKAKAHQQAVARKSADITRKFN